MPRVKQNSELMQNVNYHIPAHDIQSTASPAECYVCGKGLQDGHSITAKTFLYGTALFCDVHYSLQ